MPVPSASERGRLRLGFFTSAAVNVMLFHASMAKSEPTIATAIRVMVPTNHVGLSGGYGCVSERLALRQKSVKFAARAAAVENHIPSNTSAASEPIFATVKIFCTIEPSRRPRVLIQVTTAIERIARKFCRLRPTLYGPSVPNQRRHGPIVPSFQIHAEGENQGTITAVNLAKAMATAAIVAV